MKTHAFHLLKMQILLLLVTSGLLGLVTGWQGFYSALLGGGACLVSGAYFLHKMVHYQGRGDAKSMLISFYKAEILKILVTITLFCLIFKFVSVKFIPFIISFFTLQISCWVSMARMTSRVENLVSKSEAL